MDNQEAIKDRNTAYVCSIGIRGRDKTFIPAGRSFVKAALVPHSFNKLVSQGYITGFQREQPIQPIRKPTSMRLTNVENETPDAAISPPKQTDKQKIEAIRENAINAQTAKATKATAEAAAAVKIAIAAAKASDEETEAIEEMVAEDDAKAAEDASKAPEEKKVSTVENIWICNPEDIKDFEMSRLFSIYRTVCTDNNIEPKKFGDDDKGLLIAEMSSQFQK